MKRIAHLLATLLLCSCTIVNSGSFVDNIGHEHPEVKRQQVKDAVSSWLCWTTEYETWRKGDLYYVKLPVVYVQRYVPLLQSSSITPLMERGTWYYPKNPTAAGYHHYEALASLPHETYYAELTAEQWYDCSAAYKFLPADSPLNRPFRLLRADDVDLTGATRMPDTHVFSPDSLILQHLDDRRSTGNQLRRPLTWALCVVDVPLSAGVSAVGLTVELLAHPLSLLAWLFGFRG